MPSKLLTEPHPDFEFVDATSLRTPVGFKVWRQAHGLSQKRLADLLEQNWVTISRYENGHIPIPRVVELALRTLHLELETTLDTPIDDVPPKWTPAENLAIDLLIERDMIPESLPQKRAAVAAFIDTYNDQGDIDNAIAGDKRAMIRLRKACGLSAFKSPTATL